MSVTQDLGRLLDSLWETPEDWKLRLIAADAAEEVGRQALADCLRWMADNKKRVWVSFNSEYCHLYNQSVADGHDTASGFPNMLFKLLDGHCDIGYVNQWKEYSKVSEAEQAIYRAWAKIAQENPEKESPSEKA